jgi:hypothetical protein
MAGMSGWDWALLVIAAYISTVSLVRLLRHRRDEVLSQLRQQIALERKRKRAAARRERQRRVRMEEMGLTSPAASRQPDHPAA